MKFQYLILLSLFYNSLFSQVSDNYSDDLLSTSFKVYQEVDFDFADVMFPFIKKRFLEHLKDTSSFNNPYNKLSKYIGIKHSSDSLVKTYSWNIMQSGCCHSSEIYAQFKTQAGDIKFIDLKDADDGDHNITITDLKMIQVKNKAYYLILGWGTCCGGKHYSTAKVYEIKDGIFSKSKGIFNGKDDLYIGANRGARIALKYHPELKTLSYNSYGEIGDSGFYEQEKRVVKWKLKKQGFTLLN